MAAHGGGGREAIAGNLCGCTGYENIVVSVLEAARLRQENSASKVDR